MTSTVVEFSVLFLNWKMEMVLIFPHKVVVRIFLVFCSESSTLLHIIFSLYSE